MNKTHETLLLVTKRILTFYAGHNVHWSGIQVTKVKQNAGYSYMALADLQTLVLWVRLFNKPD